MADPPEMRFPDFLVIGAMKSGTTSLFFDLRVNPRLHLPEKEIGVLASDAVLETEGRRAYAEVFDGARPDQLCGDVSTTYAKLPDVSGVAQRARRVLGADTRIVYLVREPLARALSHHHHDVAGRSMAPDVDRAVREEPALVDYSRYWMQLQPWLEAFGDERVRLVRFEDFVADRRGEVAALSRFLGVEPETGGIETERVFNRGDAARLRAGRWWRLSRGEAYQRWVRPWLPRSVRSALRRLILPEAPPRPAPPSLATVDLVLERVAGDVAALSRWSGRDEPLWDLDAVRASFADGAVADGAVADAAGARRE